MLSRRSSSSGRAEGGVETPPRPPRARASWRRLAGRCRIARLAGKVAIVTGAAEGIGRAVAELFAREGAAVSLLDLQDDLGRRAAGEIAEATGACTVFASCDVSDEAAIERAVAETVASLGAPTVLVNNAAVFILRGVEATVAEWQRILAVNVMGPALVAKHVVPHMRAAGGGAIVNVSSVAAFVAQRSFLTYCATKAALAQMTGCMALDLVDDGIRVNGVCPGAVWSATVARLVAAQGLSRADATALPGLGREQMMKRIADPREVAQAVLFLASDEASFVTGENLMVDGGWRAA